MITLPFTQVHLFFSMLITEIMVLSDPNYSLKIGSETYFSLAVGAFVGIVFVTFMLAIKFGSSFQFKKGVSISKVTIDDLPKENSQRLIKVVAK